MAFCSNCGQEIDGKSKFCSNCGAPINAGANEKQEQRKTVYEGEIHKCPNCGEVLNSFALTCPSCGCEIRGNKSSSSVHEFAMRLSQSNDEKQKIMLIRSFPIPNSKEDILEFVILASTNIESKIDNELSDAWQAKFEQAYQKANMLFKDDDVFGKIQEIYINTTKKISKLEQAKKIRNAGNIVSELMPVLPNLIVVVGWLLSIFIIIPISGTNLDVAGFNSYQLLLWILFIVGVFLIPPFTQSESSLPRLVTTLGLILSIIVLIPLCGKNLDNAGFSSYQLILVIDVICGIIILVRMIKKKPVTSTKLGGISMVIAVIITVIFLIVYAISTLFASLNNHKDSLNEDKNDYYSIEEKKDYDETYEWPNTGLCTYLPKPNSENGKIDIDSDSTFKIFVYKVPQTDFETYVDDCIEKGFDVDSDKAAQAYNAYNNDGYKLHVSYDESKEMYILLEAPMEMKTISWPSTGIADNLPQPKSDVGIISTDSTDTFSAYVGNTSLDDFNDYVDKCLDGGFDIDYSRYDESFYAENKAGDNLTVTFEGNNTMYINVYNWD